MNPLIFVYGTLRHDAGNGMGRMLARYAEFVDAATFQGKLYKIDGYPGVVPTDNPSDIVKGEIYCLSDPEIGLTYLDEYEECSPGFTQPTEYIRTLHAVKRNNGEIIQAWVYVYNRPTDPLEWVQSGDYLKG